MNFSFLAKILVHQPALVLLGISMLSISCTIIPLLLRPLPDFSDPQKGFNTRGTPVSNRIMSWKKLIEASEPSGILTSNPQEFEDQRRYEEEQFKPRKKKKNVISKRKNKTKKVLFENGTRSNSVEQDLDITKGVMKNSTSDSKNRKESVRLLFEELQNNNIDLKSNHFREPNLENFFCSAPDDGYVQLLIASTKTDLFTAAGLYEICRITRQLESISPYASMCETQPFKSELAVAQYRPEISQYDSLMPAKCCRPWTLANYVALMYHRSSCLSLSEEDVLSAKRKLVQCAPYFFDKRLESNCGDHRSQPCKVPSHCMKHNAVYNILTFLISTDYAPSNLTHMGFIETDQLTLHETMIFLPISTRANNFDFYKNIEAQMHHLRKQDIFIIAINLGEKCKDDVFNEYLLKDSRLMILGGLCVLACMWAYTSSIFLTLMTVTAIIFSLSLAYFMYTFFYNMNFFPFMNLLAFVVAIGVGSDDAFIFHKIWTTVKSENVNTNPVNIMTKTLDLALTSMAVTSITTSAAFMVSTVSSITAIRCFGIFAGTSVLINYIVMSLWIPSCFVIYDRFLVWLDKMKTAATPTSSTSSVRSHNSNMISLVGTQPISPVNDRHQRPITRVSLASSTVMAHDKPLINDAKPEISNPDPAPTCFGFLCSLFAEVRCFCDKYRERFVVGPMESIRSWILYIVTGPPLSAIPPATTTVTHHCIALPAFIALTIVAILSAVVVFYNPRLRLPESDKFQLFSDSHPFEQYDMVYKDKFLYKREMKDDVARYKMPLRFVWGVLPTDDGNHLDPNSMGRLHLDPEFNMTTRESQLFLFEFCTVLKRQPFFKRTSGPTLPNCFILSFHSWMKGRCTEPFTNRSREPCCEKEFPYDPDIFNKCVTEAMTYIYATPRDYYAPGGKAGPYFNKEKFPEISAVVIEYESNHIFSLSYTEMYTFVTEVENFFKSQLELAPHTMRRGWFISDLVFYDIQHSLSEDTIISIYISMSVALIILFGTTLNILTSLYAIFTIVCSILVTLSILVLYGWRLNILESVAVSSAIGLAIDFSLHYTVKYNHYSKNAVVVSRRAATRQALGQMIGPTSMAALTTSISGFFMIPSDILAYIRIGVFLVTVMGISWVYATFQLGIMLAIAGPEGDFGQFRYWQICENIRRTRRRRRRRRQNRARSVQLQMGNAQSPEKDSPDNGNLANDEAFSHMGSHEMESLTQSTDLGMVRLCTVNVMSSVEETTQQPVLTKEFEAVAGPSGINRMRDYESIIRRSSLKRRASCTTNTQVQVHAHASVARVVSNSSSGGSSGTFCDSARYLNEQSPSTESAITIIMPDQDEN